MDSMSIDNHDGHRSSRTMTKTLSLYLFTGWLGASWGQQGTSGCRGDPPPGKGWPLNPCPPPGKPLCLWSHPQCCHAGFTFPAPQVSHTAWPVPLVLWSLLAFKWKGSFFSPMLIHGFVKLTGICSHTKCTHICLAAVVAEKQFEFTKFLGENW